MHKRRNIICNVHADLDCSMGLGPAVRNLRYHVFQGVVLWWEWKGGRNRKASQTRPSVMDRRSGMERSEDPLYSIPPSQGAERSGSGSGRLDALPITVSQICSPPSLLPPLRRRVSHAGINLQRIPGSAGRLRLPNCARCHCFSIMLSESLSHASTASRNECPCGQKPGVSWH
jgi:hypothetical protein